MGDRFDVELEELAEILIVLGTNLFGHRALFDPPIALHRIPGPREGARVFDMDINLDALAAVSEPEPLDDVQLLGMRGAERIR